MENSQFYAISGLIGTFVVPFIVLYLERRSENRAFINISGDRKLILQGKWVGTYIGIQESTFNNLERKVEANLIINKKKVTGNAIIINSDGIEPLDIKLEGGFRNDRFLMINYSNPDRLQFGTMILELKSSNDKLIGNFMGYGHNSEKIVHGNINFKKVKS
jgi:hypothetical protein